MTTETSSASRSRVVFFLLRSCGIYRSIISGFQHDAGAEAAARKKRTWGTKYFFITTTSRAEHNKVLLPQVSPLGGTDPSRRRDERGGQNPLPISSRPPPTTTTYFFLLSFRSVGRQRTRKCSKSAAPRNPLQQSRPPTLGRGKIGFRRPLFWSTEVERISGSRARERERAEED